MEGEAWHGWLSYGTADSHDSRRSEEPEPPAGLEPPAVLCSWQMKGQEPLLPVDQAKGFSTRIYNARAMWWPFCCLQDFQVGLAWQQPGSLQLKLRQPAMHAAHCSQLPIPIPWLRVCKACYTDISYSIRVPMPSVSANTSSSAFFT